MTTKAGAYQEYNQAAIVDRLLASMPEIVRALAEPLSRVDKITVVSTGDGNGNGAGTGINRVTGDMTQMIAQVPAILESLTGLNLADMMSGVAKVRDDHDGSAHQNGNSSATGHATTAIVAAPAPPTTKPANKPAATEEPTQAPEVEQ